jgi:hypothetical protein
MPGRGRDDSAVVRAEDATTRRWFGPRTRRLGGGSGRGRDDSRSAVAEDALLVRRRDGGRAVAHPELVVHVTEVGLDGRLADEERAAAVATAYEPGVLGDG